MWYRWAAIVLLGSVLNGLCTSVQANTTVPIAERAQAAMPGNAGSTGSARVSAILAPPSTDGTQVSDALPNQAKARIALLLPLRADTLRPAAEAVRAGFMAAYEREQQRFSITVLETGDAPQDILSAYSQAAAQHDIVVGPLSRSGVAALAQSNAVSKPTIALTAPDTTRSSEVVVPHNMLMMGLSIEDEARQAAEWASENAALRKAYILFTKTAWQRRAAKAFETQWRQQGLPVELIELAATDGFLNGKGLLQLKKQLASEQSVFLFAALDTRQARQVRAIVGHAIPMYGTSQLNPFALSASNTTEPITELNGTRLLDMPWQLQASHPVAMVYPRLVMDADQQHNADIERLYALGIDAFRVAEKIASQHTDFVLEGVTGKIHIRFDPTHMHFERSVQQAEYRDGNVVPLGD